MAIDAFFQATWGRHKLWCSAVSTDNSRTQVVHELTSGDVHPVQDRGMRARRTRCTLLFDDFPGESSTPLDRFRQLKASIDSGAEAIFTHPVDGSYLAKVGEFTYDIDANSNITGVSIEFIATEEIEAVSPAGAGASGISGEGSVTQAADDLQVALDDAGIESTIPVDAVAAQESWTSSDVVSARQVLVDTAALSDRLSTLIEDEGLEDDLELWELYRASIMMGDAIRSAAIAATSEVPSVFVLRVRSSVSLLPLAANIYGGSEAEDRARQIADLNDIRTPGWIPAGTDLLMPAKSKAA